jgi:hypothetical protein
MEGICAVKLRVTSCIAMLAGISSVHHSSSAIPLLVPVPSPPTHPWPTPSSLSDLPSCGSLCKQSLWPLSCFPHLPQRRSSSSSPSSSCAVYDPHRPYQLRRSLTTWTSRAGYQSLLCSAKASHRHCPTASSSRTTPPPSSSR